MTSAENTSAVHGEVESSRGAVLAAVFAAALGCFTMGLLTMLAAMVHALNAWLMFYSPAGALSGEATLAVVVWLGAWMLTARLWKRSAPGSTQVLGVAYGLLVGGLLLSFPPFIHLLIRH